jgi:hypothetical protein
MLKNIAAGSVLATIALFAFGCESDNYNKETTKSTKEQSDDGQTEETTTKTTQKRTDTTNQNE